MKNHPLQKIFAALLTVLCITTAFAQEAGDAEQKRAAEWVGGLKLDDAGKKARITEVIAAHLRAIRDWHNDHPATNIPAGINPITGRKLSDLDRQIIADSALPSSVHSNLMAGLKQDLDAGQVAAILDQYTVGKVDFTLRGYRSIVPDLTPTEEKFILSELEQARETAVDYKNMREISAIFEIHKTRIEQYLNEHGRDWRTLYKNYVNAVKAAKAKAAGNHAETNATAPQPAKP